MRCEAGGSFPIGGTITDTDSEPSGQLAVVWVATQVCIRIGDEKVWSHPSGVNQSHFNSTLEVLEDLFYCVPVIYPWIFNEAAKDTNNVGNVRLGGNSKTLSKGICSSLITPRAYLVTAWQTVSGLGPFG